MKITKQKHKKGLEKKKELFIAQHARFQEENLCDIVQVRG